MFHGPAPQFPKGYTAVSQNCDLVSGQHQYVSLNRQAMGTFTFCTQLLRKDDTGAYYLNPYVYVKAYYLDAGTWHPDFENPLQLVVTCRVSHAGEQDYSLTAASPSGNGPTLTASCGRLMPHAVTATTPSDLYTIKFTGYTMGGHAGPVAPDSEVHFPGAGKPTPEQRMSVPG